MVEMVNPAELMQRCRNETDRLLCLVQSSDDEEQWTSLLDSIKVQTKQTRWGLLHVLKLLVLRMDTVFALKNLIKIYVRQISDIISEDKVTSDEALATELLAVLKGFWALCCNQHSAITKQVFGKYRPELYDVLPSLASVYVDLFVASNRSKDKVDVLSKRLFAWLNFELNERCLKTALLEVSDQTSKAVTFLLPVLRKVLSPPPSKKSYMDYLLHFVLLRRWDLVSEDLKDVVQTNLNVKAPKNFMEWLHQKWPQAAEHVPQDKSLKGRRVSEHLCSLDKQAVEELIDVFTQCLWSEEERDDKEDNKPSSTAETTEVHSLFVIDKKGSEQDKAPPSKRRKLEDAEAPTTAPDSAGKKEQINGIPKRHSSDKTENSNYKKTTPSNTDAVLGFVLDRTPGRKRKAADEEKAMTGEERKNAEEDMEVDENDDDEGSDEGEDESENSEEENKEGDVTGSEVSENEDATAVDIVEDSLDEEGDDNSQEVIDTKKTPVASALFSAGRDPVAGYFVNVAATHDKAEPEIEVIDGMEIQAYGKMVDDKNLGELETESTVKATQKAKKADSKKKTPKSSNLEFSSDEDTMKKKGKEACEWTINGEPEKAETENQRVRTESESSAKNKNVESSPSPAPKSKKEKRTLASLEDTKPKREDAAIVEEEKQKQEREKSPSKLTRTKRNSLSQGDVKDSESKKLSKVSSTNSSPAVGNKSNIEAPASGKKSKRLRSVSESSPVKKLPQTAPVESPHNTRRLKRNSESCVDHLQSQKLDLKATNKNIPEEKNRKPLSPKKKKESGNKAEITNAGIAEREKSPVKPVKEITADQVGSVLSQIRLSMNDDGVGEGKADTSTRSTRLRGKSESSDVGVELKTSRKSTAGRKSFTGIKEKKGADGTPSVLSEWLRKTPESQDVKPPSKSQSEDSVSETPKTKRGKKQLAAGSAHESSSDGEITFNPQSISKTYSKTTAEGRRSPKRLLIEAKTWEEAVKTPKSKSPKICKANSASAKKAKKARISSGGDKSTDAAPEDEKSPETTTENQTDVAPAALSTSKKKAGTPLQRKYYLRGTSPIKSPSSEQEKSLADASEMAQENQLTAAPATKKTPRKSPAERRKSLRSAAKHQ